MLSGGDHSALPSLAENFLDLLPVAVYICDAAGIIRYFNRRAAEIWGRTPTCGDTELWFCGAFRFLYPDGTLMPHASTPMADALRTELPQRNIEMIIERPDGFRMTVMVNIEVIRDEAGALSGAVNVFQDITTRKRVERHLTAQLGLTQILAHVADFSAVAPRLLQTTCEHLGWEAGILWIVEPKTNALRCAEIWHRPSLQIPEFAATSRHRTFAPGVGLPGRVWASSLSISGLKRICAISTKPWCNAWRNGLWRSPRPIRRSRRRYSSTSKPGSSLNGNKRLSPSEKNSPLWALCWQVWRMS